MLSWRSLRLCVTAVLAVALVLSGLLLTRTQEPAHLAVAPVTDSAPLTEPKPHPEATEPEATKPAPAKPAPKPVVRTKETLVPKAAAGAAKNVVAELPETRTTSYGMVGVTWSPETTERDITVEIRSLVKDQWTQWQTLELDDDAPGDAGRPGTEPFWVGEAEGVAVRVSSASGTRPDDIKVMTIDPGGQVVAAPAASTVASLTGGVIDGVAHVTTAAAATDGTPTFTPPPAIFPRAAWGAAAGGTCSAPLTGNSTHGVVVHHTAGNNTYTKAESAAIVRGIQTYHVQGHDWCDIGYNFLVDKYGQIFEGRKGGTDRAVRAAHSGNGEVNTYAMGVSMMGDYDKVAVPEATKDAMVKLIGWRMGTNFLKAKGTYKVAEKNLTLNMISGHRNVVSTTCPGKYAYAWLSDPGGLRDRVEAYISKYATDIKARAAAFGTAALGPLFIGEADAGTGRLAQFANADLYSKAGLGAWAVSGGFRTLYTQLGAQASALGFPRTDTPVVATDGTFPQRFEGGSIFATRTGATIGYFTVWGPTATKYADMGEAVGVLGRPTSSVTAEAGGTRTNFAQGFIRFVTSTNSTTAYNAAGAVINSSTTTPTTPTPPAVNPDLLTIPASRVFTLRGHGFGHGIGMSQYGAQNAATQGKTYAEILAFYYPGTVAAVRPTSMRVLITKDTTTSVVVQVTPGLRFRRINGNKVSTLKTKISGKTPTQWKIIPLSKDKKKSILQYKVGGKWKTRGASWTGDAQFEAPILKLYMPDGSGERYREVLRSALPKAGSTTRDTVNLLSTENYVRGVVSAEMPLSWKPEALKAQAVAARTYAVRGIAPSRHYDMCDTTSCQVYRGVVAESAQTNVATDLTAHQILTYGGAPAFTQFSSASGGWSAAGGQPYLASKADPYDAWAGNPVHDWTLAVNASTLEKAYPKIGTLQSIRVIGRDGAGDWGGRVTAVSLVGSKSSATISGATMRTALGLRSTWFSLN